jgi:alpha/beta superfamily hydrolase
VRVLEPVVPLRVDCSEVSGVVMETARVESSSGVTLSVRVFRPTANAAERPVTMLLVHQYSLMGGCQELLRGLAYRLANQGFTTVTFDMRGVGSSTGKPTLTGASEIHDVVAVCQWASQHCTAPSILLVGSSAGERLSSSQCDRSLPLLTLPLS